MATISDMDVDAYVVLMTGPRNPSPTDEEREAEQAKAVQRKAFLASLAERTGKSMGKLEKDLGKMVKKRKTASGGGGKPAKKAPKAKAASNAKVEEVVEEEVLKSLAGILPAPAENTGRTIKGVTTYHNNPPAVLAKHLEQTGGKWRTRFPPEPNGYLHIGHAKAMFVNFGQSKMEGGECLLRFDDTNPKAEKQEYIDAIIENIKWLGHEPCEITYSSDYFEKLLELGFELIKRGKAFVCHQTGEETKASREILQVYHRDVSKAAEGTTVPFPPGAESPFRNRSVEVNTALFQEMVDGKWPAKSAVLRMKMDLKSPNANMWDHAAYRVLGEAHPRTGNKFCVYPTYDYTHCLVDSLENVTHSLCTLEFADRQVADGPYHWLVDALDMFHACTWEYSRCSISANVLSKRKLMRLVESGLVIGWDDPRLLTLAGLRRRGYSPTAINNFCERIGIARSSNTVCLNKNTLEHCAREELDHDAKRVHAVLDPLAVEISDMPSEGIAVELKNHPNRPEMGVRQATVTPKLFIERGKFNTEDNTKGYKGLTPGKTVRLMGGVLVTCTGFDTDAEGIVCLVKATLVTDESVKAKDTLVWVPSNATPVTANLYTAPFKDCMIDGVERDADTVANKRSTPDKPFDFIELFDPASWQVKSALVEPALGDSGELTKVGTSWQFITLGYFCVDTDSTAEKPVINLIVSLRESK